jgi:hypothetical protein
MPLPGIVSGKAKRCTAKCKARGDRCLNPAAWGCKTCRYHGARRPSSIKRCASHPQYKHGKETLEEKTARKKMIIELRALEELSFALGLAAGPRWRGRKPSGR